MAGTNGTNGPSDGGRGGVTDLGAEGDEPSCPMRARFRRVLEADPAVLSVLRQAFRRWLRGLDWPDLEADDLVLALNEAASNVIDHAYRGDPGDLRVLAETLTGPDGRRRMRVTVTDSGRWRPMPTDPGYRGRGLRLMRACNASLSVDPTPTGTCATMISRACRTGVTAWTGPSHRLGDGDHAAS